MRKDFGRSVFYAGEIKHGSHRTAGDKAVALNRRPYEHLRAGKLAIDVMRYASAVGQRNLYCFFKRLPESLLDGRGRIRSLGRAETHFAFSVANDQSRPETETAAAGDHARDAPKVNHFLVKLRIPLIKTSLSVIVSHKLKLKPSFPASFGRGFYASVIFITAPVKNDFFDFGLAGFLRKRQPQRFGPLRFSPAFFPAFQSPIGNTKNCLSFFVVNYLR